MHQPASYLVQRLRRPIAVLAFGVGLLLSSCATSNEARPEAPALRGSENVEVRVAWLTGSSGTELGMARELGTEDWVLVQGRKRNHDNNEHARPTGGIPEGMFREIADGSIVRAQDEVLQGSRYRWSAIYYPQVPRRVVLVASLDRVVLDDQSIQIDVVLREPKHRQPDMVAHGLLIWIENHRGLERRTVKVNVTLEETREGRSTAKRTHVAHTELHID